MIPFVLRVSRGLLFLREFRRSATKQFCFHCENVVNESLLAIPWSEFASRRKALCTKLQEVTGNGRFLAILFSGSLSYKAPHVMNRFKPNSDFYYLTGLTYPDACLLLTNMSSSEKFSSILFVNKQTPDEIRWEGMKASLEKCYEIGFTEANYLEELPIYLQKYFGNAVSLYIEERRLNYSRFMTDVFKKLTSSSSGTNFFSVGSHIHPLRSVKSPKEIEIMRVTCTVASLAFLDLMRNSHENINENTLAASFDYSCRMQGACGLAYIPVVAGGNRANTIHYMDNCHPVRAGELVLVDAGCEVLNYCSDISRTFPVCNEFTKYQEILYGIVLDTQKSLIEKVQPGVTLRYLHSSMRERLMHHLNNEGVIKKWKAIQLSQNLVTELCPHFVGHHLGLDVHDSETLGSDEPLVPGNVVTIEPGIYVDIHNTTVREEFRGVGIRIEDDILVTENSNENLTGHCPKEIAEILSAKI